MKNFRNMAAAAMMIVTVTLSTFAADGILVAGKDGILISDKSAKTTKKSYKLQPCTQNSGILVAGFTGILVAGFTGILVAGASQTPVNCGILISD